MTKKVKLFIQSPIYTQTQTGTKMATDYNRGYQKGYKIGYYDKIQKKSPRFPNDSPIVDQIVARRDELELICEKLEIRVKELEKEVERLNGP
jgi:hypothetical protein